MMCLGTQYQKLFLLGMGILAMALLLPGLPPLNMLLIVIGLGLTLTSLVRMPITSRAGQIARISIVLVGSLWVLVYFVPLPSPLSSLLQRLIFPSAVAGIAIIFIVHQWFEAR
jgi:hypothetical protein